MNLSTSSSNEFTAEPNSRIFRTCSTVLGIVYIFLMIYQKATQKKFPSERFENRTIMALHIICGVMIVYLGCFLHIQNEIKPVLKSCDESETYRIILYYVMGSMSFIHSLTVLCISPFVMGEKRITVPLYIGAGLVNLHNGIIMIINPGLQNAFTLWGSVNTFMYQRAILVLLMFAMINHGNRKVRKEFLYKIKYIHLDEIWCLKA